ncbi:hypothetical protein RQM59_06585 [Flavobacteriaceae bacterium S356]|uniref:Uncharacterized protein n=1 Tax=Asprobacillus argus TaxID=3076534 RepID=A0ABU3LEA2_9FLAO|nr:hypothetical protein [Flavobacteriaceae bacterium S356]
MHKHLILLAYKKARKERRKIGDNQPSTRKLAKDIASEIDYNIGERSLRDYYNEAREKEITNEDINISQITIVNSLSRYLNYKDYEEFLINYNIEQKKKKDEDKPPVIIITHSEEKEAKSNASKNSEDYNKNKNYDSRGVSPPFRPIGKTTINKKVIIIINTVIVLTVGTFILNNILSKNSERWMLWQEDHYTEVKFDITRYLNNDIEPYDKIKFSSFKKITTLDCDVRYFNEKGESITWYWKRGKNDLDVFTAPGKHPINGIPLKPMTRYMVRTHICTNY